METTVERLEPSKVRLTVTVTAQEVDEAIDAAYKRIASKIRIPGFRAGKAPKAIIDTHVGREAVLGDAQDDLLGSSYTKALDAERLRPLAPPEVDEFEAIAAGEAFEYVAEVDIRPELTLASVEGLAIEVPPAVATDREIDAQIEHMRERFATLEPVEDRGVQNDDFVLVSFVGLVDGEAYEGNTVDRYLYELGRDLMPAAFDEAMIGAKPGDQVVATFEIPENTSNPDFAGKAAEFTIDIHEVKAKALPALDDEFAATAGGFDTMEELRTSIREQLDHSKAVGRSREVERAARVALAERLVGDVPEILVDNMRGEMMRDFINGLESRSIQIMDYLQATGTDMESLEASIKVQAAQSAREELALEALFRGQGWEITDEDIDVEIAMLFSDSGSDPAEMRRKWEDSGVIDVLRSQIMHRRAVEWLTDPANVEISEVEPSEEPAGAAEVSSGEPADETVAPADEADGPADDAASEE